MDLRQLRHFVTIVECGGFARAAEAGNVSQPAVSASIAQLEASLSVTLLERGAFGARPTAAGRQLYDRAKLILSEVRRTTDEMTALREGEGGSVAFGIGPLFEHTIIPGIIADFVARRPKVNLSTAIGVTAELFESLSCGELDFTISSPTGWIAQPNDLDIEVLQETEDVIVAAANHPLWKHGDYSLSTLTQYPWIVSARVNEAARNFFLAFASAGVEPPRTLVKTDSIPILRELVLDRAFLCVVSRHFAMPLTEQSGSGSSMRILPTPHFAFPRQICLARRSGSAMSRAARELFDLVRASSVAMVGAAPDVQQAH